MTNNSQTTFGQLFQSISRGFQQTPLEILLFFFIVFALLTIFIVIFFAQKRKANLAMVRPSRVKIGLADTRPTGVPESSAELAEGSAVLLVAATGARFRGTIVAQGPFVTSVKLSAGGSFPGKGVRISLYFHNSAGIYSFSSRIVDVMKDVVHLEQNSNATFHQPRRKYFRRKEYLPVYIRAADSLEAPKESILLDVGGGGASLQNPQELLKKGEMLELSFSPETEKQVLVARVVRVSKLGKVLHVKFEPLTVTERKRVMTYIFALSRRQGNLSGQKPKKVDVIA
jgi:hypothetical protein